MAEWQFWILLFGVWFNILFMVLSHNATNPLKKAGVFWKIIPVLFLTYSVVMLIKSIFG